MALKLVNGLILYILYYINKKNRNVAFGDFIFTHKTRKRIRKKKRARQRKFRKGERGVALHCPYRIEDHL